MSTSEQAEPAPDNWDAGAAYERYVGRWSRQVATEFVRWLALAPGLAWADVRCGTGALASTLLETSAPSLIHGIDPSDSLVSYARHRIRDERAHFETGDTTRLPWAAGAFDATVSGLALNLARDAGAMTREMIRVTRPGGRVAAYVWDFTGGMQMMGHFWDAASVVSPHDVRIEEADRYPVCQPEPLRLLFEGARLAAVAVRGIDIATVFRDFDDYWTPFLGRQGAAPTYLASLGEDIRERIRLRLKSRLEPRGPNPIQLAARAWAVQGTVVRWT